MAAAVAPAHYIRTIHTSFTASAAAHHHHPPRNAHAAAPAAWAVRPSPPAAAKEHVPHAQYTTTHTHYQHLPQQQQQPGSISTHNTHYYTHHLGLALAPAPPPHAQAAVPVRRRPGTPPAPGAPAAPAHGRRRSASIRVPPAYANAQRAPQGYKFDPFADDEAPPPLSLSVTAPLSGGFQANRQREEERSSSTTSGSTTSEGYRGGASNARAPPYTIHIPAAQPTEIMQYAPSSAPSATATATATTMATPSAMATPTPAPTTPRSARLRSLIPINGPLPGSVPTTLSSSTTLASTPPPSSSSSSTSAYSPSSYSSSSYSRTSLSRSPSPPSGSPTRLGAPQHPPNTQQQQQQQQQPPPNLSKIVAGILLNRVHAVGKPMRRRVLPRSSSLEAAGTGAGAVEGGYRKSCLSCVVSLEL